MAHTIYEAGCRSIRSSRRSLGLCGEKLFPGLVWCPGDTRIKSDVVFEPRQRFTRCKQNTQVLRFAQDDGGIYATNLRGRTIAGASRISSSGVEPRFIQRDEKLPPTMCAPRRGKKDHFPWTMVHRLLLAVRAFDQMSIGTKIDKIAFRHNYSNPNAEQLFRSGQGPLAAETISRDGNVSVR